MQQLQIEGGKDWQREFVEQITPWAMEHLLGKKLAGRISIQVVIGDIRKSEESEGSCDFVGKAERPRKFIIKMHQKQPKQSFANVFCHELIHVKQFAKGELRDYPKTKHVRWQGVKFHEDDIDYWDQPWEIEAFGKAPGLYARFLDSRP